MAMFQNEKTPTMRFKEKGYEFRLYLGGSVGVTVDENDALLTFDTGGDDGTRDFLKDLFGKTLVEDEATGMNFTIVGKENVASAVEKILNSEHSFLKNDNNNLGHNLFREDIIKWRDKKDLDSKPKPFSVEEKEKRNSPSKGGCNVM